MTLSSTISNQVIDPSGAPVPFTQVQIMLLSWGSTAFRIDDLTEVAPVYYLATSATGQWSVALERNANITPSNSYYIAFETIPSTGPTNLPVTGVRTTLFQVGAVNQTLSAAAVTQPLGAAISYLTQAAGDARYVQAPGTFAGTVTTSLPGDAGTAGAAATYSRGDHKHIREVNPGTYSCRVSRNAALSVPNTGSTLIAYDTLANEDPSAMNSSGTFTVKQTGMYLIMATTTWTGSSGAANAINGVGYTELFVNGVQNRRGIQVPILPLANIGMELVAVGAFALNDTFQLLATQNSTTTPLPLLVGKPYTRCEVRYLGAT